MPASFEFESYIMMMQGEHNPERLTKIIGYLDDDIKQLQALQQSYEKLRKLAAQRLENSRDKGGT